jgi:hypothetical protein
MRDGPTACGDAGTSPPLSVTVLAALLLVPGACARAEPPQWDAGAGVSLSSAPLPGDAAPRQPEPEGDAGAPSPAAVTVEEGEEWGKLPQTRERPQPAEATFDARARALFDAVAADDVDRAMPFFFPRSAYAQVKAIANPTADWKARLVAHYARDIHALHARLGDRAAHARFVAADVPLDRARWVEPGEEYNRLGYYRVYGAKLHGEAEGTPVTIDVTSLISWRGEWFVVHLTGVK